MSIATDFPTRERFNAETSTAPGLLSSFFGLFTQTSETTETLLACKYPHYAITSVSLLFFLFFGPFFGNTYLYQATALRPDVVTSLFTIIIVFFCIFHILNGITLTLLGFPVNSFKLFGIHAYSLVPVTCSLFLLYCISYWHTGIISLQTVILGEGLPYLDGSIVTLLPLEIICTIIFSLWIYYHCLKAISDHDEGYIISVTILSVLLFIGSIGASVLIADILHPGSYSVFTELIVDPQSATWFEAKQTFLQIPNSFQSLS